MSIAKQLWLLGIMEVILLAAVGLGLFELGWPGLLLFVLGGLLVLRALVVLATWGAGRLYASPAPTLSATQTLAMLWRELLAYQRTLSWQLPFAPWMAPDRLAPCNEPLLLVHGYGCNRGIWAPLRERLMARGLVVATVTLEPPFGHIDQMVPQLAERVDAVLAATGAPRLVLVAHSMGGLVCRDYLARYGCGKISRLITLATPHQGSELANLGVGRNAREMEPDSGWLLRFANQPICVPAVSVRTPHDNFVMPQDRQRMAGMVDLPVPGMGHMSLLYTPTLPDLLLHALALAPARPQ